MAWGCNNHKQGATLAPARVGHNKLNKGEVFMYVGGSEETQTRLVLGGPCGGDRKGIAYHDYCQPGVRYKSK